MTLSEYTQWLADAPKRELAHKIKLASQRLDYWTQAETKARTETPRAFKVIHAFKAYKKQAQADLNYWQEELKKVA